MRLFQTIFSIAAAAATTSTVVAFPSMRRNMASTVRRMVMKSSGQSMRGDGAGDGKKSLSILYTPKTQNQRQYYKYLKDDDVNIVICSGPAGSGKTAMACHYAIEKYKQGVFKKIVITRPLVTVEEDIGFLPGTLNKKMEPWTRPMMDIFNEYYPISVLTNMLKEGIIEISPLAFMRGRTFKDAIIIADEMQNSSPNQMLMVLTRIGDASKMIITGDMKQSDTQRNGLVDFLHNYRVGSEGVEDLTRHVKVVELNNTDIVRHHVVSKILQLYEEGARSEVVPSHAPYKMTVKEAINVAFEKGGVVDVAKFAPIPDFTGGNSTTNAAAQDCALIPQRDMDRIMRGFEKTGTTESLFGEECFIDSCNISYTDTNTTQIRKR